MKKSERGVLTIEASIILTLLTLFILFLFSFARVYRAQNLVSHAAIQAADAMAIESYLRETALQNDAEDVVYLANVISQSSAISKEGLQSFRSADIPSIAKEKFIFAISNTEQKANEKLEYLGVKDGLSGLDFTQSKVDLSKDDVVIAITYTIEMQFPVFGAEEIQVTKAARAKTFGEILFEVTTEPETPGWGTTSGDSKVTHGSNVEITATPNYGYVFVGWSDGSTENPRKVTVTDTQHYVAIFKKDKFGVNLSVNNASYGSTTGSGNYDYLDTATIKAVPNKHYKFLGWDDNGDGVIDVADATRSIIVDKTYNLKACFEPVEYTISVKSNNNSFGTTTVQQGSKSGSSIKAKYGSRVKLIAVSKNSTLYKFSKWSNNSTQSTTEVLVDGNKTYTANFEYNIYTVTFVNSGRTCHTTKVVCGSSIDGSKRYISSSMASNPGRRSGYTFDGWVYNSKKFTSSTRVNGNITVNAKWNKCGHGSKDLVSIHQPYCSDIYSNGHLRYNATLPYREYSCNTCGERFRVTDESLRRHRRMNYKDGSDGDDFWQRCNRRHPDSHYGYCGKYYGKNGRYHTWNGHYHVLCGYCHKEQQGAVWCYVDGALVYYDLHTCAMHGSAGSVNCPF